MIGFPLRLLAREVYDRVVAIKGASQVALITGEERIVPTDARWFLCTAEAMPHRAAMLAFVALDEAQLGADPERGHVFTDRMLLHAGREETMILGSASSEADGPRAAARGRDHHPPALLDPELCRPAKLSRLPPRSAIVAFSAEQVYAVAEMLRRMRGGAAVVMGALVPRPATPRSRCSRRARSTISSPPTRSAWASTWTSTHVAFAGLAQVRRARGSGG